MENYNMKPGLKLMSLGFNCYLTLLEERIRGPFDNIACGSIKHLQAIFNKEYLNIVSNIDNVRLTPGTKYIDCLNLAILHNEYNEHFLENQAKRVKNFEWFIEKARTRDDYYFIAYILDESIAEDCKNFLEKECLFEKTIIFSHHKKVSDLFKNSIFVTPPTNSKALWSLDIIKQLLKYFNDHGYKTKWWWNWDTNNPPKDWKNFNLNPNLNYMSLGYNGFFNCVASRIRGPVDNLFCDGADYIYRLCDKSYLNIALNDKNIQHLRDSIYYIDGLNLNISYKPDKKWKNQQIKRYANFRKFINNLQNSNDYYFLLYCLDEKYAFEYKRALEDNGLMEKTIVFSHKEIYLELFKNTVLIDVDFEIDTSKNEVIQWCQPLADKIYEFFQTNGFTV